MAISTTHNPADWSAREDPKTICLFDVDGTLSLSRKACILNGTFVPNFVHV